MKTKIAKRNRPQYGWIKGQHTRFVNHHYKKTNRFIINKITGCWEWALRIYNTGYGMDRVNRKRTLAHRAYYQKQYGPIKDGLVLDHLCKNRKCVNPEHLEPITQKENVRRGKTPKISLQLANKIRSLLNTSKWGEQRKIAQQYGISEQVISSIKHNRSWK